MAKEKENDLAEAVILEGKDDSADTVRISPDVIAIIAGLAAADIPGIAGMSGGIVGGIAEKLGRKDLSKGIKVALEGEEVQMELNIIIELGVKIIEAAGKLKDDVRKTVENITGLKVKKINVNVLGIHIPREGEEKSLTGEG